MSIEESNSDSSANRKHMNDVCDEKTVKASNVSNKSFCVLNFPFGLCGSSKEVVSDDDFNQSTEITTYSTDEESELSTLSYSSDSQGGTVVEELNYCSSSSGSLSYSSSSYDNESNSTIGGASDSEEDSPHIQIIMRIKG